MGETAGSPVGLLPPLAGGAPPIRNAPARVARARLLLLLAALSLLACAWAAGAEPAITFDSEQYVTVIFRYYAGNNSYSSNLAGLSSFKLFADDARPGDMI
ncbi:MAG: hypothetical protein LM580_12525, partial [Thermofilum sp.]|nr:hypothetical protein [Thermofilum sp.]